MSNNLVNVDLDVGTLFGEIAELIKHNKYDELQKLMNGINEESVPHNMIVTNPNFMAEVGKIFYYGDDTQKQGPFCYKCFTDTGKFVHAFPAINNNGFDCQGPHDYLGPTKYQPSLRVGRITR